MNTDATSLDRLHDIIAPTPVPWWPPAPGWYWVMAFAFIVLVVALIAGFIRWQRNRYRREALAELARQEAALENPELRASALLALSELLKRTALTVFPREQVATLTGPKWFEFLDLTAKGANFRDSLGALLEKAVYDPRAAEALDQRRRHSLVEAIGHWIKHHDPRIEPETSEDTAHDGPVDSPSKPALSCVKQPSEETPC